MSLIILCHNKFLFFAVIVIIKNFQNLKLRNIFRDFSSSSCLQDVT